MALISLVYVSLASHKLSDNELKEILDTAREFNGKNNITGMLLYRDGFFIQALEGEEKTVMDLYAGIAKDERHRNVLLVYKNDITERSFANWAMGYNPIDAETAHNIPGFHDFLTDPHNMDFFAKNPSRATVLLDTFKNRTYF